MGVLELGGLLLGVVRGVVAEDQDDHGEGVEIHRCAR